MLRNSIQHYLYHKQKEKEAFTKFLKFFKLIIYVNIPFVVIEAIRVNLIGEQYEFWLNYIYFTVVLCLLYYWMPTKKEYGEWKRRNTVIS
jgi:hypothetical protein